MPSTQNLAESQFDEDGVPIAIGFQPIAGNVADGVLEAHDKAQDNHAALVEQQVDADNEADPQEALTGYDLVADMMRRQDEVLEQVDELNARIELAIDQASAARKSEIEALEAAGQLLEEDDQAMNQSKAA